MKPQIDVSRANENFGYEEHRIWKRVMTADEQLFLPVNFSYEGGRRV